MEIFYQNIPRSISMNDRFFTILLLLNSILILGIRFLEPKRYLLNIFRPNVYLFEYESHIRHAFSFYSMINFLMNLISFSLICLSFLSFSHQFEHIQIQSIIILIIILTFFKFLTDFIIPWIFKKQKYFLQLRFIRNVFENHLFFYFFILSFLIYYFPYKNITSLIISILIIIFIFTMYLFNIFSAISKHTNLSGYQIFLYLCTSEIIPIVILVYWISLQTL